MLDTTTWPLSQMLVLPKDWTCEQSTQGIQPGRPDQIERFPEIERGSVLTFSQVDLKIDAVSCVSFSLGMHFASLA